jgi:hypothetical protein
MGHGDWAGPAIVGTAGQNLRAIAKSVELSSLDSVSLRREKAVPTGGSPIVSVPHYLVTGPLLAKSESYTEKRRVVLVIRFCAKRLVKPIAYNATAEPRV